MLDTIAAPRMTEDDLADLRREVKADRKRRRRWAKLATRPPAHFEAGQKGYTGRHPAPSVPVVPTKGLPVHSSRRKHDRHPSSGYFGVTACPGGFRAVAHHGHRRHGLGVFATAEEAAKARDKKVIELRGIDAALNFPEQRGFAQ